MSKNFVTSLRAITYIIA